MLKNTKKRKIIISLVIVSLISIGLYYYGDYKRTHTLITNDQELKSFMMNMKEGDLAKYKAYKAKMYKQDKYGGDTPQKTWKLFVDALKKGDTDLASKYFVLEKQDEIKVSLGDVIKNNFLHEMIGDLSNNYHSLGHTKAGDFRYIKKDKQGVVVGELILILNKQTNKWKIESL